MGHFKRAVVMLWIIGWLLPPLVPDRGAAAETKQEKAASELQEVVVTATKTETEIEDVSTNVTIITEEEIKKYKPTDIFDLLRHVPGLNIVGYGSMKSKYSTSFRGNIPDGRGVLVMLDGIEVNNANNFNAPLNVIPYNIERIEVVKSPASALYGVAAVTGVINIITKKPTKPIEGETSFSYGSFNRWEPHAYVGGLLRLFRQTSTLRVAK